MIALGTSDCDFSLAFSKRREYARAQVYIQYGQRLSLNPAPEEWMTDSFLEEWESHHILHETDAAPDCVLLMYRTSAWRFGVSAYQDPYQA